MARDDLIERYLIELDSELRLPRRLRRRIVAEAREHLRESVLAGDTADVAAQMEAIDSFGTPARVAADFARELAIGSTRRAARRGGLLFLLSLVLWDVCTSSFIHAAPGWINDGPGSALLWIIGQVGLVAGTVSLARVRVARRSATLDSARLRYAVRGLTVLATCTAVTVLMAGSGVIIALINPAAHHGLLPLGALILACAAVTTISAATVWQADRRLRALEHPPLTATGREALADLFGLIGEGFVSAGRRVPIAASLTRALSPSWQRAGRRALDPFDPPKHPWRYGCAVGLPAGAAIPLRNLVVLIVNGQLNGQNLSNLATSAPALIAIEFGLVLTGYATLGAYLGLRPREHKTQISDR